MPSPSIGVLIVEDDPVAASVYEQLVHNKEEFTVVGKAKTAEETKQLLYVITPDLVLLDVQLPDANGIDLLFHLRDTYEQVDVIMITASNDAKTVSEAMRGGAFSYMLKPILLENFYASLEDYKEARGQSSARNQSGRVFNDNRPTATKSDSLGSLPKGIDKHTLRKVTEAIFSVPASLNAEEVGQQIGASHSTARRYLEYLVSEDQVIVEIAYGTVGRPERRYKQAAPF